MVYGGARRSLEISGVTPALYISIDTDTGSHHVVKRAWPDAVTFNQDVGEVDLSVIVDLIGGMPELEAGLFIGGPPCQGFSRLNRHRRGFDDPRSEGIFQFRRMFEQLKELTPQIAWHMMLENVASMTEGVRSTITRELKPICDSQPLWIDAEIMGHVRRPRLYWLSWKAAAGELTHRDSRTGYI